MYETIWNGPVSILEWMAHRKQSSYCSLEPVNLNIYAFMIFINILNVPSKWLPAL